MRFRIGFALLALVTGMAQLPGMENSWGTIKKIAYFHEQGDEHSVLSLIAQLKGGDLPRQEKGELVAHLLRLGDDYRKKKNHEMAEALFNQCLRIKPEAWTVYNRLDAVRRSRGSFLPNIRHHWRQIRLLAGNFPVTFLVFTGFFYVLFFSGLLAFFFFALFLFWKYSLLAVHDFIKAKFTAGRIGRFGLLVALFVWPILFRGGWAVYPFILAALFWKYMGVPERRLFRSASILLLVCSLFLGFSKWLEKNASTREFGLHQRIYNGRLQNIVLPEEWGNRDLQVFYAYYLYESGRPDLAKKVIATIPDAPRNPMKEDLMGILNYAAGAYQNSLENFRESLNINNKNRKTLRNLTLALRHSDDQKLYESYLERFPQIPELRSDMQREKYAFDLLQMEFPRFWLWKHVLRLDQPRSGIVSNLREIGGQVLLIPIPIYLLFYLIYRLVFKHLFRFFGDSEHCSKCLKIVKRKQIEHAHILCDDCYQLFMMKEPVFFDARILKEKEITRRTRLKGTIFHLISLIIPGFALNFYERSRTYFFWAWIVFFLLGFSVYMGNLLFQVTGATPLFFKGIGAIALVCYVSLNLYSVKGWDNGF